MFFFHMFIFYYLVRLPAMLPHVFGGGFQLPTSVPQLFTGVSKENLLWPPNKSVYQGHHAIFVFLPSLLFTCSHAPLLLLCIRRSVVSGCFQNFEFLDQQKSAGSWVRGKERWAAYLGLGELVFLLPLFSMASCTFRPCLDPVGIETEEQITTKWSQKDLQNTHSLNIQRHMCREQTYGHQGGKVRWGGWVVVVGWIGRLGLTYVH